MRNVALGLLGYLNKQNQFPNGGTFGEVQGAMTPPSPQNSAIAGLFGATPNMFASFIPAGASGNPLPHDIGPLHSWVVDVLPHLDQQQLYNDFNRNRIYNDPGRTGDVSATTNLIVAKTGIPILTCPVDDTKQDSNGNLTYVVNGGFARWTGYGAPGATGTGVVQPPGWIGSQLGGQTGPGLNWGHAIARQTGVMSLGTFQGNAPWDSRTTASSLFDGASTTALVTENILAGASNVNTYTGAIPTTLPAEAQFVSWASPHPNFVMFIASDNVCGGANHGSPGNGDCVNDNGLSPIPTNPSSPDGPAWADANRSGNFENIGFGLQIGGEEGSHPYPNSRHGGGVNVGMCDGSVKFVNDTINGTVWSKVITPRGGQLPLPLRQTGLDGSALEK
jgi:prepilin-type processing-associated H-X9-DG protein